MILVTQRRVAVLAAAALFAVGCQAGPPAATPAPAEPTPATTPAAGGPDESGWPYTGTLADGSTFQLKDSIREKLANGEPINYVFSYGSASIPLFSPQYLAGYERSLPEAQRILPTLTGTAVAPASAVQDINEQVAQIQAQWQAGNIDCLSIQPTGEDAFTKITNDIMAEGIPVFTVGVESSGNELSNYTQVSTREGAQAARIVLDWMERTGNDLKVFAVSGGDPTQNWAQGRMRGFIDEITANIPDAEFLNDETSALVTTYDPAGTYDAYMAFIQGNPEVQLIENVDIGAEHAARAIEDSGNSGSIWTIGWNVSLGQLDAVERGTQIAALDQQWGEQAAFGAVACAEFLANGNVLPNTQELKPVTSENVDEAREEFLQVIGED
jgi:ribose transport system substrate-binding protein